MSRGGTCELGLVGYWIWVGVVGKSIGNFEKDSLKHINESSDVLLI